MKILVVDGQGGGIGKALVAAIKETKPDIEVIAVGTNSTAASAMKKAGADAVATGENPVIYNACRVDLIAGPMGILLGNAMYGEITPKMASAISSSDAKKYLIPINQCNGYVLGVQNRTIQEHIQEFMEILKKEQY